ncbi:SDR family oxidoreductase [Desulfococcus multivorans]|uniref:SDR family oxidoreductase n=1 Tax=Desulfococcus multivorans TaxID=897 RepID=UPI00099090D9|nr:SDR family oxidoreductase [Desulfococcus multivorans]AQV01195.1 3-ketoacyl-ACP reductase [Desulfococcus multivorans]
MKTLTGKSCIVTGASRGIGRAIAERLGRDGASVIVNYFQNAEAAHAVASTIKASGGCGVPVKGDVGKSEDVRRLFDAAADRFGKIDILVNNAGIAVARKCPVAEVSDDVFDRLFAVNTRGVFSALREGARRIADHGRIITLSSTVVSMALPGYGIYAATKAAVEVLTRILSKELGDRNITVNAVAPGPVDTDLFNAGKTEAVKQQMADMCPLHRLGRPEDIANVVAFLVSDQGGWVNGQIVRANGGMV